MACNSQGFWTPWWWLRLIGRDMLGWLNNNKLINPKLICAFCWFVLFFSGYYLLQSTKWWNFRNKFGHFIHNNWQYYCLRLDTGCLIHRLIPHNVIMNIQCVCVWWWDSVASIMIGPRTWRYGVLIAAGTTYFSFLWNVQTACLAHSFSYLLGTGVLSWD